MKALDSWKPLLVGALFGGASMFLGIDASDGSMDATLGVLGFLGGSGGYESMASVFAAGTLRDLRRRRGFSQAELAVEAGVAQPTISRVERGKQAPHGSTVRLLAGALGVETESLFGEEAMENQPLSAH